MNRFWISDEELAVRYRQAKDSREMVQILSELCATSRGFMENYLRLLGCTIPDEPSAPRRRRITQETIRRIRYLKEQGATVKYIAETLHVGYNSIKKAIQTKEELS